MLSNMKLGYGVVIHSSEGDADYERSVYKYEMTKAQAEVLRKVLSLVGYHYKELFPSYPKKIDYEALSDSLEGVSEADIQWATNTIADLTGFVECTGELRAIDGYDLFNVTQLPIIERMT